MRDGTISEVTLKPGLYGRRRGRINLRVALLEALLLLLFVAASTSLLQR